MKAVVVVLLVASCGARHPELHVIPGTVPTTTPTSPSAIDWDCAAGAGRYASNDHDVTSASGSVTGTAYLRAVWSPTEWFPQAAVAIQGNGRGDFAGVNFTRYPRPADSIAPHIMHGKPDGSRDQEWYRKQRIPLGAPLRFELRWTADRLEVRFPPDADWSAVPPTFTPVKLHLGCTSSQVTFRGVTITSPAP